MVTLSSYKHRNPYDFEVQKTDDDDVALSYKLNAAAFGVDEFSNQQKQKASDPQKEIEYCKAVALRLLGQRSHSEKELKTKLLDRNHPPAAVNAVIERLQEVGLQSDAEFADAFTRSKWRQVKWGPSKIKSELTRRGLSKPLIDTALENVFHHGIDMKRYLQEEEPEDEGHGPSPEAALLLAARREFDKTRGMSIETRRRRFVGWLQRRGHKWDDVKRLLDKVETESRQNEQEI